MVGVQGPAARRTVSPTRTTGVMFPPERTASSMRTILPAAHARVAMPRILRDERNQT